MKKIISIYRNSKLHLFISYILEKFQMEGFTISYSQLGEDLIIKNFFGKKIKNGVYVDVGCNNPIQKSNTFKLYLQNWNGVVVDGNEKLIQQFKKIRKRDTAVCALVSNKEEEVVFYINENEHEYSSIDTMIGEEMMKQNKNVKKVITTTKTLDNILANTNVEKIDLLCIDVEGFDFMVLQSINLTKYQPKLIVLEADVDLNEFKSNEIVQYLHKSGYDLYTYTPHNCFFKNKLLN